MKDLPDTLILGRVDKKELFPADLSKLYREILTDVIRTSETSDYEDPYKRQMLDLLVVGRKRLSGLWREGFVDEGTDRQMKALQELKEIRALYVRLNIAEMLTDASWSVDREEVIPAAMGTVPLAEIERQMLYFYKEHGKLRLTGQNWDKLIHLDLGCGNAVASHRLRNDMSKPFEAEGDEGTLGEKYWTEFGYADKIYFTLNDLIRNTVKPEHQDDPAVGEFVETVSTLLLRKIQLDLPLKRSIGATLTEAEIILSELPSSPELIREILPELDRYIDDFSSYQKERKRIKTDEEFLQDDWWVLSSECRKLIRQYCENPESREAFLQKYFQEESLGRDPDTERQLREFNFQLNETYGLEKENEEQIMSLKKQVAQAVGAEKEELGQALNRFLQERRRLQRKKQRLEHKRAQITKDISSNDITIYPHNVILGRFEMFDNTVPRSEAFNFVHSFRASSHADNNLYMDLVSQVANRLKPGGLFLDDGVRESYTRYHRIEQLRVAQEELGSDYRVSTIENDERLLSVAIEKVLEDEEGERHFFLDQYGERILLPDCERHDVGEFAEAHPRAMFRNAVIRELKIYFMPDQEAEALFLKGARPAFMSGKMKFKSVYKSGPDEEGENALEAVLAEDIFSDPEWQLIESEGLRADSEKFQQLVRKAVERLGEKVPAVKEAAKMKRYSTIPVRPGSAVRTYSSPEIKTIGNQDKSRQVKVSTLPKNRNVPTLDDYDLELERRYLLEKLGNLRECLNAPPIRLIEFKNCFTNPLMTSAMCRILGVEDSLDQTSLANNPNIIIERIDLEAGQVPEQANGLHILGGSLNDSYDQHGQAFTNLYSATLLDRVSWGEPVRVIGVCFGSQTLLEAYGQLKNKNFSTRKGPLQFGSFPAVFPSGGESPLEHLGGKNCSVILTRSGYSTLPEYQSLPDMQPLAFEGSWNPLSGVWEPNRELAPIAFSLMNGRVVTSQFHPEIRVTDEKHLKVLREYLERTSTVSKGAFGLEEYGDFPKLKSAQSIFNQNIDIKGRDEEGNIKRWVQRDIDMAWLIPTLKSHTQMLLDQMLG